jgi:predicted HAD superfamily Cof-like phosphohydrolase
MNYLSKVSEFHKTFDAPILESPQIPSDERCQLRVSLLQEELNELKQAIDDNDIDLQYVLSGAILEFGLGEKFDELFDEVQRSNMSKACSSIQEAIETISHYKKKDSTESSYKMIGEKCVVYRDSDNKVLKSINYSPADLKNKI